MLALAGFGFVASCMHASSAAARASPFVVSAQRRVARHATNFLQTLRVDKTSCGALLGGRGRDGRVRGVWVMLVCRWVDCQCDLLLFPVPLVLQGAECVALRCTAMQSPFDCSSLCVLFITTTRTRAFPSKGGRRQRRVALPQQGTRGHAHAHAFCAALPGRCSSPAVLYMSKEALGQALMHGMHTAHVKAAARSGAVLVQS